ncbi:hypothetical protein ACFWBH_30770 [Streptomyces sp. NPDC059999]
MSLLAWDRAYRDGPGPVLTVHPRVTHTPAPDQGPVAEKRNTVWT